MPIDPADRPVFPVHVHSVTEADIGEMDETTRAIAIGLSVPGVGNFTAFGIDLADGSHVVTTIGSIPDAAMKRALEVTQAWLAGDLIIPYAGDATDRS